jgi:cell division septum initiation protein DivIVA
MKRRLTFVASVVPALIVASIRAEEPPSTPSNRKVGSVYGKAVTAAEIGLTATIDAAVQFDARDAARWQQMQRIARVFGKPIADRFVKERKIDATTDEIEAFKRNSQTGRERRLRETEEQLAKFKADLRAPNLTKEKRNKLQEEVATLERQLPARRDSTHRDVPEAIARTFIVSWKIERELYRAYGGRVIFQQFGPEALDARRLLYEEAERNGDLKFDDPGVRHMFYYYANMRHVVTDAKALENPWFLGGGD